MPTVPELLWTRMEARDWTAVGELLAEDVVCDWPQSGERIRGRANFVALNAHYPGDWHIRVRRVVDAGDVVVTEVHVDLEGGVWPAVSFFSLRDGRIERIHEYWPDPFPAAAWRDQWVERMPAEERIGRAKA